MNEDTNNGISAVVFAMRRFQIFASLAAVFGVAEAQFPPTPEGLTTIKSKFHENVTISYKEPGICETTPGVKSYAGYVRLPPGFLNDINGEPQDYPINTFFWFFESRKDPANAPLAIWLNGGPGGSSMMGLLEENGPCMIGEDSKSTVLNPWSWNNEVNMLYIDEPVQVGFSYDELTNCTVKLGNNLDDLYQIIPTDFSDGLPELNYTTYAGTLASQVQSHTANSTAQAAHALWHFAQTWFFEFPAYKPEDDRISLWAESYGGHYGPGFMRFFQTQNEKIENGTIEVDHAHYLHLDTLGIVNGALDDVIQGEAYIDFPYFNTYGIKAFNDSIYVELKQNWTTPGGCRDQFQECQDRLKKYDVATINRNRALAADLCDNIDLSCDMGAVSEYMKLDYGWFDIGHPKADPFPPPHMHGYLTEADILQAIGSPVNFTWASPAVGTAFSSTRDMVHGGFIEAVGYLLDHGVKVHMMYGDRDYACNWFGGEAASLAIPYSRSADFASAGYAPLLGPDGATTGLTRQYGNYSFTRVFQAGHEVPRYQPATAYSIFMRATFNADIATGLLEVTDDYGTTGPKDVRAVPNQAPERPEPRCYVRKPDSCSDQVWEKVVAGKAVVKDWFVVGFVDEEDGGSPEDDDGPEEL
ncbi:hypothetical protein NLU13_5869 [Sarocladium strictum]|uniref:Carboxypeptidase n=1 Tax=Sarocladium strictum TaxID=5046 RepID=A0AA39GEV7_SARSR|nr:hypothetical protein NLU13_5869 [Sarocladium strictum]